MADLLPTSPDLDAAAEEPRVLGVDEEDAEDVLSALSAETAREILAALYEDPATPSEVADSVDTSLQNAQYHLENLTDADLVEVRGTRYSEKGREMDVYGPADAPLVLFAGGEREGVEQAVTQLLGAVGVLAAGSLVVQWLLTRGGDSARRAMQTASAESAAGPSFPFPPGALFFLGGLVALAVVAGWWAWRRS
ncbi:MAG: ArsR/SmtB family transcription factor [Halobacteriaceae archaeon]